jgi:hypothetical protein
MDANTGAVGKAHEQQPGGRQMVCLSGFADKVDQFERSLAQFFGGSGAFARPFEEARRTELSHFAARTQEGCARRNGTSHCQQAAFIAAGTVQQQQCGRGGVLGRFKSMDKT